MRINENDESNVTNLTYYNELILEQKVILNKLNKKSDSENQIAYIEWEIEMIETLLEELKLNDRTKRGVNECVPNSKNLEMDRGYTRSRRLCKN